MHGDAQASCVTAVGIAPMWTGAQSAVGAHSRVQPSPDGALQTYTSPVDSANAVTPLFGGPHSIAEKGASRWAETPRHLVWCSVLEGRLHLLHATKLSGPSSVFQKSSANFITIPLEKGNAALVVSKSNPQHGALAPDLQHCRCSDGACVGNAAASADVKPLQLHQCGEALSLVILPHPRRESLRSCVSPQKTADVGAGLASVQVKAL
jgi:hypothetical protein